MYRRLKKKEKESVRQLQDHPSQRLWLRTILHCLNGQLTKLAVNHALVMQSRFIHQTWSPASFEIKDTEVRAYRTDPVQVRSWNTSLNNFNKFLRPVFFSFNLVLILLKKDLELVVPLIVLIKFHILFTYIPTLGVKKLLILLHIPTKQCVYKTDFNTLTGYNRILKV